MGHDYVLGFGGAFISVVFFGSNFVPVKKFATGDGVFYQWVMCCGSWMTGLVVQLLRGAPTFYPNVVLGGVLWCTGNLLCVPVINCIGMGLGLLLWGGTSMIVGWCSGHFGLWGLNKDDPAALPALNYIGAVILLFSLVLFIFVKDEVSVSVPSILQHTHVQQKQDYGTVMDQDNLEQPLLPTTSSEPVEGESMLDRMSPNQKRVFGVLGAMLSGVFFGVNMVPAQYMKDHGHSQHELDYVFAHFCGIFITSTFFMVTYAAIRKNHPLIYPQLVLPGFLSGVIWSFAMCGWFVANQELSFSTSFPIVATGPGVVASLWGVFLFKEIKGRRNFMFLGAAFATVFVGVGLVTVGKLGL